MKKENQTPTVCNHCDGTGIITIAYGGPLSMVTHQACPFCKGIKTKQNETIRLS